MGRIIERGKKRRKARADMKDRLMLERIRLEEDRKLKRIHKRNRRKVKAQHLSDEEAELSAYTPAMAEQLDAAGIEVENPNDSAEVAAKYNAEILKGEEVPTDDYNTAYIFADDSFDDLEHYTEERTKAQNRIRGALGVIGGAIKGAIEVSKEKKRKGEPLTDTDKRLLELNAEASAYGKKQGMNELKKFALPLAALLLLYIVLR